MPRRPRIGCGGLLFHVMNRGARRAPLFDDESDYRAFARVLREANARIPMRVLAFVLMPNHWHLVLWPREDPHLSTFMAWATATHVRRWHLAHQTVGTGTIYQGRFKAIPVKDDGHFLTLCRYVERNPVRAGLATHAEGWPWSSASPIGRRDGPPLASWPVPRPADWSERLNTPESQAALDQVRRPRDGPPLGPEAWARQTASRLGWQAGLRRRGRPVYRRSSSLAETEIHSDPAL